MFATASNHFSHKIVKTVTETDAKTLKPDFERILTIVQERNDKGERYQLDEPIL